MSDGQRARGRGSFGRGFNSQGTNVIHWECAQFYFEFQVDSDVDKSEAEVDSVADKIEAEADSEVDSVAVKFEAVVMARAVEVNSAIQVMIDSSSS
jgi:hypothetical protein